MNNTSERSFELYLMQAEQSDFTGWNFSFLVGTGRMQQTHLNWNYYNLVYPHLFKTKTLLDTGTGGGEFLSKLSPLPEVTIATELYEPNVEIARRNLEPLGVQVVTIEKRGESGYEKMPFSDNYFDMTINCHESYFPPELKRIVKKDGLFITQQVGSKNLVSLVEFITDEKYSTPERNLKVTLEELVSAGFTILKSDENILHYRFYDVGAIAYLFKALPWMIEGFNVSQYQEKLWQLHLQIENNGYYETQCHRFMIVCKS